MSGFSDLPGYAMNKCKDPVGFLKVSVEIIELQSSKNVMSLYFIAEPHHYNIHTVDSTEQVMVIMIEYRRPAEIYAHHSINLLS